MALNFGIAGGVSGTASIPETESSAVLALGLVSFLISQIVSPVRLAYRRQEAERLSLKVRFWNAKSRFGSGFFWNLERVTRFELVTSTLARSRSTS